MMAGSPRFKIHNPSGEYIASCKLVEDAAAIVGNYGDGATIKDGGRVVWREGREAFSAAESYDGVHETVWERVRAHNQKALAKLRARGIEL